MITIKMKPQTQRFFLLGIFTLSILTFLAGVVSATTIFSDNFTDVNLTGWTITPSGSWTYDIGNYAQSSNVTNAILQRTISTSGFENITVKYDRQITGGFEADNNFTASWSADGITFTNLETVSAPGNDTSFVSQTFSLPSTANNNANFILRFGCATNAATEFCRIDNVVIEGTAITTTTIPPEITACNTNGNPGELRVRKIDFSNKGLSSGITLGEDNKWFPFEEIEVQIKIENNGNEDVDDISVEWGIWDTKSNQWVIELDEEDEINLKDGDQETLTTTFKIDDDLDVDLADLNDGDNYRFYVIAKGTVDNSTSPTTCVSDFETASIIIESDFVILDNFNVPESVQCGGAVEITADVWNIGDNDQDDVSVLVSGRESVLGIDKIIEVGDIDAFDNQKISLSFTLPKNLEEKYYGLRFKVLDEDGDVYETDFDDDPSDFIIPLVVKGGCAGLSQPISISAELVSGGKAGQDLVVKAKITNTGTTSSTYILSASDFESWASSYTVEPAKLVLEAEQTGEVLYTFKVKKDVSGEQRFFMDILSGTDVNKQEVFVKIEKPSGLFGITGLSIEENMGFWALGAINIILVIIIIIVAVRVARKSSK